jgi:hypothetical protein
MEPIKQKRYWLRGLVTGLIFGVLIVYAHEHVRELGNIFGINYDGVHAPLLFEFYLSFVGLSYSFSFFPFFFLGFAGIMALQYFLPAVTYGVLGILFGWAYGKFNKKIVVFLIVILIFFAFFYFPLMRAAVRSTWDPNYINRNK